MVNIGITGTGSLIGQAIIKSIQRSGESDNYNLIGFDYFENTVGSFWCSENHVLPDLLDKNLKDQWLEELIRIIKDKKIKVLFPGVDFELEPLSQHKDLIYKETGCSVIVSSSDVIRIGNDKYLTYKFLKDNNLNYPKTYLPQEIGSSSLDYPVILKPRIGARSVGVFKIKNKEELNSALIDANEPIIQELIGNDNSEFTCGVIAFNGEVKQMIAIKRSLKGGNTFISEFKKDFPIEIYNYLNAIASKLMMHGSCNFQLRIDNNGIPKLFEINPRHSGTSYIRSLFGYNEVIYILKYVLEDKEIEFELKEGKVLRYFEEKLT